MKLGINDFTLANKTINVTCDNRFHQVAFTLAEVLITLGIIGVVASLTLPTLIQNYKKQIYVNQLKKTVSTLEQGFKKILADEGVEYLYEVPNLQGWCSGDFDANYFKKYFKIVKINSSSGTTYPNGHYDLDGKKADSDTPDSDSQAIYFDDGSMVLFYLYTDDRDKPDFGFMADMTIDVNGDTKLPNKWGRDIFLFGVKPNGTLVPNGINGSWEKGNYCGSSSKSTDVTNSNGYGCAARIIENGWRMDY